MNSVFILDFFGDLPTTRLDCREPMCFPNLEVAKEKIREMFVQPALLGHSMTKINQGLLPDPEDDRIIVWEANPETGKVIVRWAFNGWHWPHDDMPGMKESNDLLEIGGKEKSLYDLAMRDDGGFFDE